MKYFACIVGIHLFLVSFTGSRKKATQSSHQVVNNSEDLVSLFKEWRVFENPPLLEGAPDYTLETFLYIISAKGTK